MGLMERWKKRGTADQRGCVHITGGAQAHAVCNEIIVILPRLAPHTNFQGRKSKANTQAKPVQKQWDGCSL